MTSIGNKQIFADNLAYYMKKKNIDRNRLCEDLDFKYSTISEWLSANKYPRIDSIEKMANYFGIAKSQLIEKNDPTVPENIELSAREETLVANYRQLNEEGKDKADEYIEDLLGMKRVYRAARSADNHPAEITVLTKEEQERIEKAPKVTSENSDL